MALTALFLILAVAPAQNSRAQDRIAAPRPTPDWTAPHVPGQLLVKFSVTSPAAAATLAAQTGLAVQDTIPELGIAVVAAPEAGTSAELAATAAALEASPAVEWAEPNYTFTLDATPDDPYYDNSGAVPQSAGDARGLGLHHGTVRCHHRRARYRRRHEPPGSERRASGPIPGDPRQRHGIDDDGNGFIDDVHGWNFAGTTTLWPMTTVTARMWRASPPRGSTTAIGIAGMAGGATIMPVKVFFPPPNVLGTYEDLIRAIIYATDNGADVINMSLGATSLQPGRGSRGGLCLGPRCRGGRGGRQHGAGDLPLSRRPSQRDRRGCDHCQRHPRRLLDLRRFRGCRGAGIERVYSTSDGRRLRLT